MKASNIILLAALLVLMGKWSRNQKVTSGIIVGGLFSALVISILDSSQPKLARGFAYLFLVAAALEYLSPILGNTVEPITKATAGVSRTLNTVNPNNKGTGNRVQ